MGNFSFICKESEKAVRSNSFNGDTVHLFLLYNGEVIEEMFGNYDGYGRVFDEKGGSFQWSMDWGTICDLIFDDNLGNGIAAILDEYYDGGFPTTISESDPNQGWGIDGEYMGNGESVEWNSVASPYHVTYKMVEKPFPNYADDNRLIHGLKELLDLIESMDALKEELDAELGLRNKKRDRQ